MRAGLLYASGCFCSILLTTQIFTEIMFNDFLSFTLKIKIYFEAHENHELLSFGLSHDILIKIIGNLNYHDNSKQQHTHTASSGRKQRKQLTKLTSKIGVPAQI